MAPDDEFDDDVVAKMIREEKKFFRTRTSPKAPELNMQKDRVAHSRARILKLLRVTRRIEEGGDDDDDDDDQ